MYQDVLLDKGPTQKVRMKMVLNQQPVLSPDGDYGISTKGSSQLKVNDDIYSVLKGKDVKAQGLESAFGVKDKGLHQKQPTDTPHQPENPAGNVDFNIKLKTSPHQTGQRMKRRFDAPENSSSMGYRCNNQESLKAVMDACKTFNDELDQDVDIRLDSQAISKSDMRLENFKGPNHYSTSGSFGGIFHLKTESGKDIVVKEIVRRHNIKMNYNEIQTPMALSGKGIIKIFGLKCVGNTLWILMEDAGKSLRMWLSDRHDNSFRSWSKEPGNLLNMASQLFKILAVLERHGIVHRDIKPENMCAMRKHGLWIFTLIDFGSAQPTSVKAVFAGHTVEYLTPKLNFLIYKYQIEGSCELPQDLFCAEKCDVWGTAMVILTAFNGGFHPIPLVNQYNQKDIDLQRKEVMETLIYLKERHFEDLVSKTTEPLQTVLRKTLLLERANAMTAKEACSELEGDEQRVHFKEPRLSTGILEHKRNELEQALRQPQNACNNNSLKVIFPSKGNQFAINMAKLAKSQSQTTMTGMDGKAVPLPPGVGCNNLSTFGVTAKLGIAGIAKPAVNGGKVFGGTPNVVGIAEPAVNGGKVFAGTQKFVGIAKPAVNGGKVLGGTPKFVGIGGNNGRISTQHHMIYSGKPATKPVPPTANQSMYHQSGVVGRFGHNFVNQGVSQGFRVVAKKNLVNIHVNAPAAYSIMPRGDQGNSSNIPFFEHFDESDKTNPKPVNMSGVQQMNEDEDSSPSFEGPMPHLDVLMSNNDHSKCRKIISGRRRSSNNKQ